MSDRTDLPSILTRALLAAAAASGPAASQTGEGETASDLFPESPLHRTAASSDLAPVSDLSHRFLADLIMLLLLEMEGLVESPLNRRTRLRVRLGAPSRSRILADWQTPPPEREGDALFETPAGPAWPTARDPEAFFQAILQSTRSAAARLSLNSTTIEEMIRWLLPAIGRCVPEDDPVGWIHAHAQRHRLVRGPGSRLRFQVDRVRGRSQGVLYTPPPLTEALVEAILSSWRTLPRSAETPLFDGPAAGRAPTPRILDPSCGSGQFLLSLARRLLPEQNAVPEDVLGVFESLHGVDIDSGAATLAAFNLSLQVVRALSRSQETAPAAVVRWLRDRLGQNFPWFLGSQIHTGNALLLAPTPDGTTFRWTDRFASVFSGEIPGFDIVIGNPPWVSYGLRDRAGADEEEAAYLRRLYTFGAQYKLSLYPLFIELALRLTRPGGLHGFLVPDSFFTGRHFSRIRAHLLESSRPLLFCLVESGPWPGVHVGHTGFYCVRRTPAPGEPHLVTTSVIRLPSAKRYGRPSVPTLPLFTVAGSGGAAVTVDPSVFSLTPHQSIRIYRNRSEHDFVREMERAVLRFDDLIDTYSGLIARHGQESVIGPREGEFVLKERSGKTTLRDPDPRRRWRPALHSGSEVEPFRINWRGGALYIPEDREILRRVYKSGFDTDRYVDPKVLLRQTGDRLIAARDDRGLFCLNNVHILASRASPLLDLRFLCGLLMSEPIQRYYQIIALEAGRPLAQVDLVTVKTLPFPSDQDGSPFGVAPAPSGAARAHAAQMVRQLDAALTSGRSGEIAEMIAGACRAGPDPITPSDRLRGREVATLAIARIVEFLEKREHADGLEPAREALDAGFRILFGIASEPTPALDARRAGP